MKFIQSILKEMDESKPSKKSKEGVVIGKTKNGDDIKVFMVKKDVNGNSGYMVGIGSNSRKRFIQNGDATGGMTAAASIQELSKNNKMKSKIASYVNEFIVK